MDALLATIAEVWTKATTLWIAGGWCMPAIAFVCFVMFAVAIHLHLALAGKGFERVPEKTWRRWLVDIADDAQGPSGRGGPADVGPPTGVARDDGSGTLTRSRTLAQREDSRGYGPAARRGRIGRVIDFVSGETSLEALGAAFREIHATEVAPFQRDLRILRVCVAAAPLLGLLGTVTGMLGTFDALATGSGGEQTMDQVARGISEALITTEAGLVVALPGLFLQYHLRRKFDRWLAFLAHLETVCAQTFHRTQRLEAVVA